MIISAYFSDAGVPKTGLSPTINGYKVSDNSLVINAQAMTEVGGGFYKYTFAGYDSAEDYLFVCNGGSALDDVYRYVSVGTSVDGELTQVLADTNELQTDLHDGGRLDLLVDSILEDTGTTLPNAISPLALEANVQTHAAAALTAYDPPTRSEATSDKAEITGAIAALNNLSTSDILSAVVEGTLSLGAVLRICLAALAGLTDGGGTATLHFRDVADSKNRITATVDGSRNRTAIGLDGS